MSTPSALGRSRWGVWLLAALTYLPAITAKPGSMPTDTKLYLYFSPGRLIADAPFTWDNRQFAGWVPHQTIAYLWPSGPWFWVFDKLGVPDWVAHRLWIGTLLFLGGLGVRWAAKHLGLASGAASVAGIVYALSPYILPYISRTSVMLLPWAGVGWMVGLTIRATTRTRWRDAALFALVVLTIGAVNATALALVAPAPVLWLLHAAWARTITWRVAVVTALKIGVLSLGVSLWWIVMLMVQGKYGADVLAFSETLEAVSHTALSTETLRGLGYWLMYVRDPFAFTTTASIDYMTSSAVIIAGYALTTLGLVGLVATRWSQRRYAALLVVTGIVLGVGVHPIDDPSPLMGPLAHSALGLALRSSTRALPLSTFGLALGAAALVNAMSFSRLRIRALAIPAVVLLAIVNLPALWHGGFVDPALVRDQNPPAAWNEAVAALDASSPDYRVMQVPGSEFGAFRWGYTVDPPLPGLTNKPLITRDLLPLGSPGAMDLLNALDNRFQTGTIDPASIAPTARLLGTDTIWVPNDLAFDRFRTPRPEDVAHLFAQQPAGLSAPTSYGTPVVNQPQVPVTDEQQIADPLVGTPLPPVQIVSVVNPVPIVRTAARTVRLAGSGDGVVDAAAAGLLTGDELIVYGADVTEARQAAARTAGASRDPIAHTPLIVTDSNRDRAEMWRGSQDVLGFTETGGSAPGVTKENTADQRLAVFPNQTEANQTIATLQLDPLVGSTGGTLDVRASSYGEPLGYRPEDRAAMAVDGDPSTAWVVADRADPIGESITVSTTDGTLHLVQAQRVGANRRIATVRITTGAAGSRHSVDVSLDDTSLGAPGQSVQLDATAMAAPVTITITGVTKVEGGTDTGPSAVGFAELGPVAHEVVRPPTDELSTIATDTPLALVFARDHTRATNRFRSDPEAAITREFTLPVNRTVEPTVTLRLDARADDAVLNHLLGTPNAPVASERLTGVIEARGANALDNDPSTAWTTPIGRAVGASLDIPLDTAGSVSTFTISQQIDANHSIITGVHLVIGSDEFDLTVPTPDASGASVVTLPTPLAATAGAHALLTITSVAANITIDRRYGEPTALPAAITEIVGLPKAPVASTTNVGDTGCRTDLLAIDGAPLGVAVSTEQLRSLLHGDSVTTTMCSAPTIALASGRHLLVTNGGRDAAHTTGIDIDRIVLDSGFPTGAGGPDVSQPTVVRTRSTRVATVAPCPDGCWLILGEGYDRAWRATTGSESLGAPVQVSGGFNGWWLPPSSSTRTVTMEWPPQAGLNRALLLAALVVLACIVLASADRKRRGTVLEFDPPHLVLRAAPVSRAAAGVAAAVAVIGGGLLIAPVWAVYGAAVGGVVLLTRRPRVAGWLAAVLAAGLGVTVLYRQRANRWMPEAAWLSHFEDLHRLGMAVVVLLLVACLGSDHDTAADTTVPAK